MALDQDARAEVLAGWMRDSRLGAAGLTKPDVRAAIAAVDDWVDANAAALNQAFPQPFRGAASADLKAEIFAFVLWRRANRLQVAQALKAAV